VLLLQRHSVCFQPLYVALKIAIVCVLAHHHGLIAIVVDVDNPSEGIFVFVEDKQIGRYLTVFVDFDPDEAILKTDCQKGQLIEVLVLPLGLSQAHPALPFPL
jgi:MinD superfamily P-loop ATPase